ncbi:MAG TPA: Hsp20/alpha crystallin family protein [Candidatus Paceibacterota bacterium]|nr:Hsp20/alpha crystallin family protein [Candidatus Paceibacterota bacterium]
MSTFLDRLKKKQIVPGTPEDAKQEKVQAQVAAQPAPAENAIAAEQLKVDIFKAPDSIVIYAQVGGARVDTYDVLIEGDNDVVTITGQRLRPTGEHVQMFSTEGKEKILEECPWGKFYRQIILPAEVDPTKTDAVMIDGVLMLRLPLREYKTAGIRIQVNKM